MARDRQRAKQRKARRAQNPGPAPPRRRARSRGPNVPGELEHASGEVDEFEAALVAGAGGERRGRGPRATPTTPSVARRASDAEAERRGRVDDVDERRGPRRRELERARPSPRRRSSAATCAAAATRRRAAPGAAPRASSPSCARRGPSCSAYSGPTAARSRRPPPSSSASSSSPASTSASPTGRQEDRRLHHLRAPSCPEPMYRWYVVNTYSGHENKVKQNLEHRVVSLGPEARRAPGRRPDRDRLRDEGQPEGHGREAHDARLRAREHGAQRRLVGARQGHARASPASSARPTSPCR